MSRLIFALVLLGSLAANGWLATKWREADAARGRAQMPRVEPVQNVAAPTAPLSLGMPTTPAEFRVLQSQLETLGLPPDVVRAVIAVTVHRAFHQRRQGLAEQPGPEEYWRNRVRRDDPATQAALRELEREQRKTLRELSADNWDFDGENERRHFGNLAPEKVAKLKKIDADYSDLEEQLFSDGSDRNSAENRARAELLAREKRADIERALTPEELLQYDYRNHPAAHRLRGRFGQFQATEAEFVALYPVMKTIHEEAGGGLGGLPPTRARNAAEARRVREETEKRIDAAMRQALGEARYAEMKEANDHLLQQTRQFTASLNLPPQVTSEVVAVQKEFAPRLTEVDRDRDLTPNQRDAKAWALASEARERLIRALGPENFEAYKRRGGGWLGAALNRAPPTPSPLPVP